MADRVHRRTFKMRPPNCLERVWYRRLGVDPPYATHRSPGHLARLVPYRWRWFHHGFAAFWRFFWLPCPLCGREFGGHEAGGSIPMGDSGDGGCVCSECTRNRVSSAID